MAFHRGRAWVARLFALLAVAGGAHAGDAPRAAPGAPSDAPVPLEAFFGADDVSAVVLSPSGKSFAVLTRPPGEHRRLVVGECSHPEQARMIAGFDDGDVASVAWVNDDRLVYTSTREDEPEADQLGPGLFAVDRDGSAKRVLVQAGWAPPMTTGTQISTRTLSGNHWLLATVRDGSANIIVGRTVLGSSADYGRLRISTVTGVVPLRLDTRDGSVHDLVPPALVDGARQWIADDQGRIRYGVAAQGDEARVLAAPADPVAAADPTKWRVVSRGRLYGGHPAAGTFEPLAAGPDGVTYALAESGDDTSLFQLDADGHLSAEPLLHAAGFDFKGSLLFDRGHHRLAGIRYLVDAVGTVWLDPAMKAVQARVDARLPNLQNVVSPAECGCSPFSVVRVSSDRQPPVWFLHDATTDRMVLVGSAHPAIDPRRMASTEFVHFAARDGLSLPAWVTRPAGHGPWPTVVLIHGGPWVRGGQWEWSPERQFLASRGYLVVEPEFRGSNGYGTRLQVAGYRQWGRAMQDDIADATRWATSKAGGDPSRVCLMGASYGGYSTLMGLVNDGRLYRCGVAAAAPTDLIAMRDIWWSDASDLWRNVGQAALIGDADRDAEALRAASPALHADRIDKPLLLAHGDEDHRVPIDHARRLLEALRAAHQPVTWLEYQDEGHGFHRVANEVAYHAEVERFLAEHLAPAVQP